MKKINADTILIIILSIICFGYIAYQYQQIQQIERGSVISYFGTNSKEKIVVYGEPATCEIIEIIGDSMYPSMTTESTVIGENITFFGIDNIKVGDVIVFFRDNHMVCHRVVTIKEETFVVKGDNNSTPDSKEVPFSEVRFVVIAVLR